MPILTCRSCRFPFAFVGFGSGDTHVDGGLAVNLPVDHLKNEESTLGAVIGISFLNKFGSVQKSNLLSYTQQLFLAAIQSGVARSEAILGGQNIFSIDTDIGTFDFDAALNAGMGVEYDLVSSRFDTWLRTWLLRDNSPEIDYPGPRLLRPGLSDTPWPPAIVNEINDRLKSEPSTQAKSIAYFDTAILDDNGAFTGNYVSKSVKTFMVVRPTNLLQFDFQIGREGSFEAANLRCSVVNSQNEALAFIPHVQELTKSRDPLRSFRVYFLFERQLTPESPNQPYRVEYHYEGNNPYPNAGSGKEAVAVLLRQGGQTRE
jgi:hypothetical protein